jgi:hypothetical protein
MASVKRFSRPVKSESPVVQRLAKSPAVQHSSKSPEDGTEPVTGFCAVIGCSEWLFQF